AVVGYLKDTLKIPQPQIDRARIVPVGDEVVGRVFPGYQAVAVRYLRTYPVRAPLPLKARNLFLIAPDGSVEFDATREELKRFFRRNLSPSHDDVQIKDAVRAWLILAQEHLGDSLLSLKVDEDAITLASSAGRRTATGRAVVTGGGKGSISVRFVF